MTSCAILESMSRKCHSAETIEKIITDYKAGMSCTQLSERYGGSHRTILNVLKAHDVQARLPGKPRKICSEEQIKEIVAAYQSGATIAQLASQFSNTDRVISKILDENGVERRLRGQKLVAIRQAEIIDKWNAGETTGKISGAVGCDQRIISKFLEDNGIDVSERRICGEKHAAWRGKDVKNYRVVTITNDDPLWVMAHANGSGHILEHRLVMARHLGRPLRNNETVHHKNGNRIDNRIENLQLRNGNHGNGVVLKCRNCGSHDIEHTEL